jgi:hypothetical protein
LEWWSGGVMGFAGALLQYSNTLLQLFAKELRCLTTKKSFTRNSAAAL